MDYHKFLQQKEKRINAVGISGGYELNHNLFPFQKHILKKALEIGRYAIFADCGLGKTLMQLEWARIIAEKENSKVLIVAPLAVGSQTIQEGIKFGIDVSRYEARNKDKIQIINYDRINKIENLSGFIGVVLDESSIIKNFTGAIRNLVIEKFKDTKYRLCATATPAPNDPMELGNHAEFLNVMTRKEMLAMYFTHDSGDTSKWRIKKHGIKSFYKFVSQWAIMINKPSDIGFSDDNYCLPKLNFVNHRIETPAQDNGQLFNNISISATDYNAELRRTMDLRLERVAQLVNADAGQWIVWIKHNVEGDKLRKMIPDAVEVKGSDKIEDKEKNLLGFAQNKFRVLITKAKIGQYGLNYQNCHNQIFSALDFSFESLYQAIRRSYRFGQKNEVNIHLITLDTMMNAVDSIKRKQQQFERMQKFMQDNYNESIGAVQVQHVPSITQTDNYTLIKGDCVSEVKNIKSDSVGFTIFSPPFAELYTYSDSPNDMGNSSNYEEFFKHFEYLVPELLRVTMPGRLLAMHLIDIPAMKERDGFIGLKDFPGEMIRLFTDNGFIYHSRVTIWKDPVVEMQRTKALGLLHKQLKKDSSKSRVGLPDYLIVFKKPGDNPQPIDGSKIPVELWQQYASPVWMDIKQGNVLKYREAKDNQDEKHICPLQLDVIERALTLWSNEKDLVLSPFAGIGSEGYSAIKMNRKFIGIELKQSYYDIAVKNLKAADAQKNQLPLSI